MSFLPVGLARRQSCHLQCLQFRGGERGTYVTPFDLVREASDLFLRPKSKCARMVEAAIRATSTSSKRDGAREMEQEQGETEPEAGGPLVNRARV